MEGHEVVLGRACQFNARQVTAMSDEVDKEFQLDAGSAFG
jgi:hypothetical protein